MLKTLNSLWVGPSLGYLEQLCIKSALAQGHQFRLYSYQPAEISGVPAGTEVRDAAEIMPRSELLTYANSGSFALGANFWRYRMLAKNLGYWVDMDMLLLRPLDFEADYVFGREHQGSINTAVLMAPAASALIDKLCSTAADNVCPAWFGPRRRLLYYLERFRRGSLAIEDLPWGTYGPQMMTYFARKLGLARFALPPTAFYPIAWREAAVLYEPEEIVMPLLSEGTYAIHLYNSQLRHLAKAPPPVGSYIARQCELHDVHAMSS